MQPISVTAPPHLPALAGLRFVTAFWIALYHYSFRDLFQVPPLIQPLLQSPIGVSLFFILSGFTLTWLYLERFRHSLATYAAFQHARLARILPLHVLALVLMTPIALFITGEPTTPASWLVQSWLANLFLIHAYLPRGWFHYWSLPSWGISVMVSFYLVFPLFVRLVLAHLRRLRALVLLLVSVYAVEVLIYAVAVAIIAQRLPSFDPGAFSRYLYSPLVRIWEIFLGCTLGALFRWTTQQPASRLATVLRSRPLRDALLGGALIGVPVLTMQLVAFRPTDRLSWLWSPYVAYSPLACVLILTLAAGPTFASRLLAHHWLQRLGESSYSFYIIHWPPLALLQKQAERGQAPPLVLILLVLAATVLASVACHNLIERPATAWLRGLGARRIAE